MARIALDLSQFKSAGVYTVEIDQSERITVNTQSLRLLPGFSRVGPYNAPVFIRSTRDLQRFYGSLDKKLERKGSFFHRSIETCLLQSPVFAINLLNVGYSEAEESEYISLSLDSNENNLAKDGQAYPNYFNKERFWKADSEYLLSIAQGSEPNPEDAPLFQLANVGTRNISFIIRKAQGLQQYSITAKDWYGSADNIPYEWIRPNDLIKDYFIQVIAFEGDWTDYSALSTDPIFSEYFNSEGLLPNKINDFINLPAINLIGSWIGTFSPDFRDQTGANQYIEDIVNSSTPITGVLLNINNQALDQLVWDEDQSQWEIGDGSATAAAQYLVDLVGHSWINASSVSTQFLSYDIDVSSADIHMTLDISILGAPNIFTMSAIDASGIQIGSFVDSSAAIPGVTIVTNKISLDASTFKIQTADSVSGGLGATTVKVQKPIDSLTVTPQYKIIFLKGLILTSRHLPGFDENGAPNLEEGLEKIYSMLDDSGILRGLLNPDMINYRYVVDSMAYGLRPNLGGKVWLSRLAKKRGKTTAILSAPSMTQFATSKDPYFNEIFIPGVDPKPIFSTEWIPQGGNPDLPRTFRFSFPDEDNGAKFTGVFGPFLRYTEGEKIIEVPPAADISNSFVRKFLGGNPFAIVANKNGLVSNPKLAGLEYMIDTQDRDFLEPFGYNSIIERVTTGEIIIFSNRTAFQRIRSDFNFLHVRELLNTIELQVEEILKNYVFDFNNPVTRLTIINNVTPILESIRDAGALENYEITMDDTNNPPEIIEDAYAIIDIGVWVTKGMEKIIQRIAVNRTGSAGSGGASLA